MDTGAIRYAEVTRNGSLMGSMDDFAKTVSATTFTSKEWLAGHATWTIAANTTAITPVAAFSTGTEGMAVYWPDLKKGDFFDLEVYIAGNGFRLALTGGTGVTLSGNAATVAAANTVLLQGGCNYIFRWRWTVETRGSETATIYIYGSNNGGGGYRRAVINKTADFNPTAEESGTTYTLDKAAGLAILLPTPAQGLEYTFVVKTSFTTSGTITSTTNGTTPADLIFLLGTGSEDAAGSFAIQITVKDVITFAANKAKIGDQVTLFCDGTNWYAKAFSGEQDAITIA